MSAWRDSFELFGKSLAMLARGLWHGVRMIWDLTLWLLRLVGHVLAVIWQRPEIQRLFQPFIRLEARIGRWLNRILPKRLYTRALMIIIVPMVLLQAVVAYIFMERHWQAVTARLSAAITQDIAALIDIYERPTPGIDGRLLAQIAEQRLGLDVDFLPPEPLPPPVKTSKWIWDF